VPTIALQYTSFRQITADISDGTCLRRDPFSNRPGPRCAIGKGVGQSHLQDRVAPHARGQL